MVFDESEVRKIIMDCKRVLDYLAVSEVIETIEDLVQFVKDMSPCLTKVRNIYFYRFRPYHESNVLHNTKRTRFLTAQ